jgi:hypothetical protein
MERNSMRAALKVLGMLVLPVVLSAQGSYALDPHFVRIKGFRDPVRLDTTVVWHPVSGPAAATMRNLVAVLDSLKIPREVTDTVKGRVHHAGFIVRSRLAGLPISRSFRCGNGPTGEYADVWRVNIAYTLYVVPDGSNSSVGLGSIAGASDIEGASKPSVQCATTGGLLTQLTRILEQKSVR